MVHSMQIIVPAAADGALADLRKQTAGLGGPLGTYAFSAAAVEGLSSKSELNRDD